MIQVKPRAGSFGARSLFLVGTLLPLIAALLSACTNAPPKKAPAKPEPPTVSPAQSAPRIVERFQLNLEGDMVLDYQVENRPSRVNSRACFAYITGVLYNRGKEPVSKKTGLDVTVYSQQKQVFRDQTYPVADLAPGTGAAIEMVVSPVHPDGCPKYDKVNIVLRKVLL